MVEKTIFIDRTERVSEPRIVRGSILPEFWDAGVDGLIMARRNDTTFNVQTIGALLGNLRDEILLTDPDLAANLDRFSLEAFIRDMTANNFNIAFTDELQIGKRENAPTVGTVTPTVGQFTIDGQFVSGQDVNRLFIHLVRQSNSNELERKPAVTLDGAFIAQATVTVPADSYTGFIAAIDSNGLRGFRSPDIPLFTVT